MIPLLPKTVLLFRRRACRGGFSLVELLCVMAVILLMMAVGASVLKSARTRSITSVSMEVASLLESASNRAHELNTYVYIGFQPVDVPGAGRAVAVASFFSRSGQNDLSPSNLAQISPLRKLEGIALTENTPAGTGAPSDRVGRIYSQGASDPANEFTTKDPATGQSIQFRDIVIFSPIGEARLPRGAPSDRFELSLVPYPLGDSPDSAVLHLLRGTSKVITYRPE